MNAVLPEMTDCRFASIEEACSTPFEQLGRELAEINTTFELADHTELNRQHYPWASGRFPGIQLYGSRLWEYPYAILAAELQSGLACADIGCGRTPFTIYLAQQPDLQVTGFDPDLFTGDKPFSAFGVNGEFLHRTGLDFRNSGMEKLEAPDNHFDRVFCLSVIEHLDPAIARRGMQEMARILKPGGRLIMTVDIAIHETYCSVDPLSLLWESGLVPVGAIQLQWPVRRLGIGYHGDLPVDVFGMVLEKSDYRVNARYNAPEELAPVTLEGVSIPGVRAPVPVEAEPCPWPQRLRRAWQYILHGNRPGADSSKGSI